MNKTCHLTDSIPITPYNYGEYITQRCSSCNLDFVVLMPDADGNEELMEVYYCPYCGCKVVDE